MLKYSNFASNSAIESEETSNTHKYANNMEGKIGTNTYDILMIGGDVILY